MMRALTLLALALGIALPAGAQSMNGMTALQYYVGTWSCTAGPVGSPPSNATATYTMDSGVLREWVIVPPQGSMTTVYAISIAMTYDAKAGHYVQTFNDSDGGWSVSTAPPWTGNTEQWTDQANREGKVRHGQTVRTDQNTFSFTGYPTPTATQPDFQGTCHRSS